MAQFMYGTTKHKKSVARFLIKDLHLIIRDTSEAVHAF